MKHTPLSRKIERGWKTWLVAFGIPVNMRALRTQMHIAFEAGFRTALEKEAPDEVAKAQRRAQETAKETRTDVIRRTAAGVARNVNETLAAIAERDGSGKDRRSQKKARRTRSAGHGRRDATQAGTDGDVHE